MPEDNITTKIGIDISQFKRGLQDAQRQIKLANAEFQKASAGMDKWSDSATGISAKIKQLESVLDAENKKLEIQKARLQEVEKEQGANSAGADELRIAIAKQEASIAKTEKSLGYFRTQLEAVNKAEKDSKSALSQLNTTIGEQESKLKSLKDKYTDVVLSQGANSKEARALGKEIEKLSGDLVSNRSKLDDASAGADKYDKSISIAGDDTEEAGKQAENAGNGGFTVLKGVMSNLASQAITSVISGIKSLTGELINMGKQAISAYSEYEQLSGGIETMFEDLSYDVELNAKNAYKTTGLSANEYLSTVMGFSASLNQSLLRTEGNIARSADVANDIINDMADNSSKMGTDMATIQATYANFAKNQFTTLENLRLGYGGSRSEMERLLADAEKLSGKKFDISNFTDITEAIHVIQVDMGIAGNASIEASDTISGSLGAVKASFQNLLTGLGSGEDIELLISNFTNSLITFLGNVTPIVKNVIDGLSKLIISLGTDILPQLFSELEPQLPGLLESLLSAIKSLFESGVPALLGLINSELPTILNALTEILLAITNSLIDALPDTIGTLLDSAILVFETIIDKFPVDKILEVIPKIISTLISAIPKLMQVGYKLLSSLVAQLPKVLQLISRELPKIIKSLTSFINKELPTVLKLGVTLFKEILNAIPIFLKELLPQLPSIIRTIVDCLVQNIPLILDASLQLFYAVIDALPLIAEALVPEIGNLVGTICDLLITEAPKLVIAGWKFFKVIITDVLPKLILSLGKVGSEFIDTIVEKFIKPLISFFSEGWKDVMEVFKDVGEFFLNGFKLAWDNITGVFKSIGSWFADRWNDITGVFSDVGSWFSEKFQGAVDKIKSVFETIGSWFGDRVDDIKGVFGGIGGWFSETFSFAVSAIKSVFNTIGDWFGDRWDDIKSAFSGVKEWFEKKFQDAYDAITKIFKDIGAWFQDIIDKVDYVMSLGASNGITKKLGSLGIGGVTGGRKMATGGVLRKGQIGFLEGDGAEAVVPLDQNAKWINATARDMKKALEGQGVITSAGGKIVNYNFTQNNTSPKPLNRLEIYRQTQNQFNYYMGV